MPPAATTSADALSRIVRRGQQRPGRTDRFVGKLAMSDDELILDGTTTTPERRHGCVRIPRLDVRGAAAERVNGATAIRSVVRGGV